MGRSTLLEKKMKSSGTIRRRKDGELLDEQVGKGAEGECAALRSDEVIHESG